MSVTVIRPEKHLVRETEVGNFFRRELNCPEILTFFHMETGQWILAYWLDMGKRLVDEIEDLGEKFESVDPPFVSMIRRGWGGVDWSAHKKRLISNQRRTINAQNESILEEQERWDWLKKKTKDKAPVPYMVDLGKATGGEVVRN